MYKCTKLHLFTYRALINSRDIYKSKGYTRKMNYNNTTERIVYIKRKARNDKVAKTRRTTITSPSIVLRQSENNVFKSNKLIEAFNHYVARVKYCSSK